MNTFIVQTQALTKVYESGAAPVQALAGVDLHVTHGEFVAVIGKSGCGKSTLLHMLGGLDTPTSGSVVVDGNDLAQMDRTQLALFRRRRVGFIFQQYNLVPDLDVWDNVIFPLALDGAGLGLYLARMIVERQGGFIEVASEEGRGSTFTIDLPNP